MLKGYPKMKKLIRVAVTGGAGQICYNLLFRIASGELFGLDQPVALHILEVPAVLKALHGVELELQDTAFPLLHEVKLGDDPEAIFDGVDYAILVGAKPRTKGMERGDLLQENAKIFVSQGKAFSNPHVKILVVGNPCNTNALVLLHNGKGVLKPENVRAMTRLDQNRAIAQLAIKAGVPVTAVKKVAIYGNHSPTMVIDYVHAEIQGKPAKEVVDLGWLRGEFMTRVQKRGAEVIEARGASSAASAAHAAICSIRDWHFPTPKDDWYSAAVFHEKDIFFSMPIRDGKIVSGLKVDSFLEEKMKVTEKELLEEREAVRQYL